MARPKKNASALIDKLKMIRSSAESREDFTDVDSKLKSTKIKKYEAEIRRLDLAHTRNQESLFRDWSELLRRIGILVFSEMSGKIGDLRLDDDATEKLNQIYSDAINELCAKLEAEIQEHFQKEKEA